MEFAIKKLLLFLLTLNFTTAFAVSLSEFKKSLNQMVSRGLLSANEAKQYIIEYQFKLENSDDKISENSTKRAPASVEFKKVKTEKN